MSRGAILIDVLRPMSGKRLYKYSSFNCLDIGLDHRDMATGHIERPGQLPGVAV
jgi:hypothetical protein